LVLFGIVAKTQPTIKLETARREELGDTIFIEMMNDQGVTRKALPPRVANAIAAQRDSLTARRRTQATRRDPFAPVPALLPLCYACGASEDDPLRTGCNRKSNLSVNWVDVPLPVFSDYAKMDILLKAAR